MTGLDQAACRMTNDPFRFIRGIFLPFFAGLDNLFRMILANVIEIIGNRSPDIFTVIIYFEFL